MLDQALLISALLASLTCTGVHPILWIVTLEDIIVKDIVYVSAMYPGVIILIVAFQSRIRDENPSPKYAPGVVVAGPRVTKSLAEMLEEIPWDDHITTSLQEEMPMERVIDISPSYVT
ncbi:hypothetical protein BC834DRAFT_699565 [Gloeopeniophorella convolvens]|nr:hypothetical protein BC834DRAFT_699565 [Gloeopeniophorella convolvens]